MDEVAIMIILTAVAPGQLPNDWNDHGSWFAVLRGRSRMGDYSDYMALDLRGIRPIRVESGDSRPPRKDLPRPT
jgi:hypothetical protein